MQRWGEGRGTPNLPMPVAPKGLDVAFGRSPEPCSSSQTRKPPGERRQQVAAFSLLLLLLFFLQVQEEKAKQQSCPALAVPAAARGEEGPGPFLTF